MKRTWLILDCNYLCHRAKHVFGELNHADSATGVVYGFLRDILTLSERFDTSRFVFCWDKGESRRKDMFPQYKARRRRHEKLTKDEIAFEKAFRRQIYLLRTRYLPTIGFRNIFHQDGYESDDIIASICHSLVPDLEQAVIVSADQDLFQLIQHNVIWYNPRSREIVSLQRFKKKFGIRPKQWAKVKAIAGCSSDNVPGVEGVGEITALRYIKKNLQYTHAKYKAIKANWRSVVLRNKPLVLLPFKGTKVFKLSLDHPTQQGWNEVTRKLGMKSIRYKAVI